MAEIDIQKKESRPVWPWILGLVVLFAAIWLIADVGGDRDVMTDPGAVPPPTMEQPGTTPGTTTAATPPAAVQNYHQFAQQPEQIAAEMGAQHAYTAEGLRRLVAALDEVVQRETIDQQPLRERLDRIREHADQITTDPESTEHAGHVREAFTEAAMLIENVQQQRAPQAAAVQQHASAARQAAESIDPGTLLLEQREAVQRFFRESSEALNQLATAPTTAR